MRDDDDPKFLARVVEKHAELRRWMDANPCPAAPATERKSGEKDEVFEKRQKSIATKVEKDWIVTGLNVVKADSFVRTRVMTMVRDERKGKMAKPARVRAEVETLPEVTELLRAASKRRLPPVYQHAVEIQCDVLTKSADKKLGRESVIVHLNQEQRKTDAVGETMAGKDRRIAELESMHAAAQAVITDLRAVIQAITGKSDGALKAAK